MRVYTAQHKVLCIYSDKRYMYWFPLVFLYRKETFVLVCIDEYAFTKKGSCGQPNTHLIALEVERNPTRRCGTERDFLTHAVRPLLRRNGLLCLICKTHPWLCERFDGCRSQNGCFSYSFLPAVVGPGGDSCERCKRWWVLSPVLNLCDYHDCLQKSWTTWFPYPTCSMAPLTMVQTALLLLKETVWIVLISTGTLLDW